MRVKRLTSAGRERSGNPIFTGAVDYQTLVQTLDAVRATADGKPLFPAVSFAIVH